MKKLGLVMVLAGVGVLASGCDVGVRDSGDESQSATPQAPDGAAPGPTTEAAPAGDYPGPCPVGRWQLSGIEPSEGVGVSGGELSFSGGGSMVLELADDGTWTVNDDGSDPVDATLAVAGAEASGTARIEGSAEGRYAGGEGGVYAFEDDRSDGTVELNAPGFSDTLGMDDVLAAIVPTGQATVTCDGNTLTIDGTNGRWEFAYIGGDSSSEGAASPSEQSTEIREITAGGTHDCAGGSVRILGVAGLTVDLTGACAAVYIDSAGNEVDIESAGSLIVTGAANTVDIQEVDEIQVAGAMSQVTWHGDEPQISNTGFGATVQEG
jgi:hypothetical protein